MLWKKLSSIRCIGMSVTNNIKDEVEYDNITGWSEIPISNDEIINKLNQEKKKAFLSFSYGVWITRMG